MDSQQSELTEYEAPSLTEIGAFQELTGYLGFKNRESLVSYPRSIW